VLLQNKGAGESAKQGLLFLYSAELDQFLAILQ